MLPSRLIFVDTETTGTNFHRDRIIEVGLIVVDNNKIQQTYSSLVNPQTYISPFIYKLTGINSAQLENAPEFGQIAPQILPLFQDALFIAHNARFDLAFLKAEFERFGFDFNPQHLCTVRLSRRLFPEYRHHRLDDIISRFNFDCARRHRALDDAQVICNFYKNLQTDHPDRLFDAVTSLLKQPSLPSQLHPDTIKNLPPDPGIYIFYDQNHLPLYIGKSVNIRTRVFSHFSDTLRSPRELSLAQKTASVEARPTAGILTAEILESELIKKLSPIHNRQLRRVRQLLTLNRETNNGYFTVKTSYLSDLDSPDLPSILCIHKSRRQINVHLRSLVDEFGLCPKKLGLESGPGACFAYHLGKCAGACIGLADPLKYNLKFLEAFSATALLKWPFPGPVMISEYNPRSELSASFIIDNWILKDHIFDYDLYKILKRYILNPKNQKNINLIHK